MILKTQHGRIRQENKAAKQASVEEVPQTNKNHPAVESCVPPQTRSPALPFLSGGQSDEGRFTAIPPMHGTGIFSRRAYSWRLDLLLTARDAGRAPHAGKGVVSEARPRTPSQDRRAFTTAARMKFARRSRRVMEGRNENRRRPALELAPKTRFRRRPGAAFSILRPT